MKSKIVFYVGQIQPIGADPAIARYRGRLSQTHVVSGKGSRAGSALIGWFRPTFEAFDSINLLITGFL